MRRLVETTSGKASRASSTASPSASESASEVPGGATTPTVSEPSLNAGRKLRPSQGRSATAPARRSTERARIGHGRPQRAVERAGVAPLQEAQQPRLALLERAAAGEQQQAEGRGERQRDEHRGDQRREIGEAERPEQQAFDAGQEEERCEDDRDDQGREEDRAAHLRRRQEDRLERRPALALGPALVLAQAPEDVLDVDDGVVDERSDGDREAPQRHGVDGGAEGREGQDPGDQRGRQSERRDQGRAAVAEEEHQDEDDQDRPFDERLRDVADRDLDEVGLAEVLALEPDAGRKRAFELGQSRRRARG